MFFSKLAGNENESEMEKQCFDDLSPELREILYLAGFKKMKVIAYCPNNKTFQEALEEFVRIQVRKVCWRWDEKKRKKIFGIFDDDQGEFELLPGQKIELKALYDYCKGFNYC